MIHRALRAVVLVGLVAGCGGSADEVSSTTSGVRPSSTSTTLATADTSSVVLGPPERPAPLVAPDAVTALAPMLVFLHGYGSNATGHDAYLGVTAEARSRGLYVLLPEGTTGPRGRQFWDATSACCNFTGTPVDDVAYLGDLIDEAIATRPIDPARVYVFGHSNGGFMAYRLACEMADDLAAVASLAGADPLEESDCAPGEPLSVLQLHGTDDDVVEYSGGQALLPFGDEAVEPGSSRAYPGALETVARWASRNGCASTPTEGVPIDLDGGLPGTETEVTTYEGCDDAVTVQLDAIVGGGHVPGLTHEAVGRYVLDWLLRQAH